MNKCNNLISKIAYKKWEAEGKPENKDWEFWFFAEGQIKNIDLKSSICPNCKEERQVININAIKKTYVCHECKIQWSEKGIADWFI